MPKISVTFAIELERYHEMEEIIKEKGISRSKFLSHCFERCMKAYDKEKINNKIESTKVVKNIKSED